VNAKTQLLQVVDALGAACRFPRRLNRRQQECDQNGDDRNHNEKLDQCKPATPAHGHPPAQKDPDEISK
jgi:hypothetical protein